jgi:hypothetical protein
VYLQFEGDCPLVEELGEPFGLAACYAFGVTQRW